MSPSKPSDPAKGKPAEAEKAEVEATDAAEATAKPAAKKPAAKKPAAKKPAAKKAEATAAKQTGVAKDAAEAATKTGASEPKPKRKPAAKKPAAKKADADPTPEPEKAKPTKPKAQPKRAARETPAAPPMVRAQARYIRTSARKARLVCDHIRGKSVDEARAILAHTGRDVARDWIKLLESAVANAEHNHELVGDDLRIVAVKADEGPTIKRFRPRAMGRATRIRKRTSHLTITLTPKDGNR